MPSLCRFKAWLVPRGAAPLASVWAKNSSTSHTAHPRGTLVFVTALPGDCGKTLTRGGEWNHHLHYRGSSVDNVAKGSTPLPKFNSLFIYIYIYYRQYFPNQWKTGSYLLALTFNCEICTHHGLYSDLLSRGTPHLAQQIRHLTKVINLHRAHRIQKPGCKKLTLPSFWKHLLSSFTDNLDKLYSRGWEPAHQCFVLWLTGLVYKMLAFPY